MPYCIKCGSEMPEEANFCRQCGSRGKPQAEPQQIQAGAGPESVPDEPQEQVRARSRLRSTLKFTGIGCLVIIGIGFAITMITGLILSNNDSSTERPGSPLGTDLDGLPEGGARQSSGTQRPEPTSLPRWLPSMEMFEEPGQSTAGTIKITTGHQTPIQPLPTADTARGPTEYSETELRALRNVADLMGAPWVKDGLTNQEAQVVSNLSNVLARVRQTAGGPNAATLMRERLANMAFLDTPEPQDNTALKAMWLMARDNMDQLEILISNPRLGERGITDAHIPHVSSISGLVQIGHANPTESILAPGAITLETVEVPLPHSGAVSLNVMRLGDADNPEAMQVFKEAMLSVETFMGPP